LNFLAHAYLSFKNPDILVGNLISDFVKGKKKFDYTHEIQRGIMLHRMIDEFTDSHKSTAEAKKFFKPEYGLYAGAFIDIVYDHFLANDDNEFPDDGLLQFARLTYGQLESYQNVFPEKFRMMFYYMKKQDWLYHYRFREGIHNSFAGLVRRAKFIHDAGPAMEVFENNYGSLGNCYAEFFPELKKFSSNTLNSLHQN